MEKVAYIESIKGDSEHAHGEEDAVWESVLEYVAHHSTDPLAAAMARSALTTNAIRFSRWYA